MDISLYPSLHYAVHMLINYGLLLVDGPRQYLSLKNDKDLGICIFRGFCDYLGLLLRYLHLVWD